MAGQMGFFDVGDRLAELSKKGDPLERLSRTVDFELFRAELERAVPRSDRAKGGRPPYDHVVMFKVLVIQTLDTLSDAQTEFQIKGRLSVQRFLGLGLGDTVPDANTIWTLREALTRAKAVETLFRRFDGALKDAGYLAMSDQIIDASIVAAPRQKLTDEEKAALKDGKVLKDWQDKPAKLTQKDRDARWTLKRGRKKQKPTDQAFEIAVPIFGYKNHVSTDVRHGSIRRWCVGHAAEPDTRRFRELLDKSNTASSVWADTACRFGKNEHHLERQGFVSKIHFRRSPGKPLSRKRARANAARGRVRTGIKRVFAVQKDQRGLFIRTVGLDRARTKIGLANLAYNLKCFVWSERQAAMA
ncbi:MAG: IS5 family transposase [Alphaproteobacteria bacterium]